jgi:hypothetical protein
LKHTDALSPKLIAQKGVDRTDDMILKRIDGCTYMSMYSEPSGERLTGYEVSAYQVTDVVTRHDEEDDVRKLGAE